MTHEAKMVISNILVVALKHCMGPPGPFNILEKMIYTYFKEWGWTT